MDSQNWWKTEFDLIQLSELPNSSTNNTVESGNIIKKNPSNSLDMMKICQYSWVNLETKKLNPQISHWYQIFL